MTHTLKRILPRIPLILIACATLLQAADLRPTLSTPVVAKQKKIRARVHQPGEWKIVVQGADKPIEAKATATSENEGTLVFDLTEKIADGLKKDWIVRLLPPTTLSEEEQKELKTETTVVANTVTIAVKPVHEGDDVVEGTVTGAVDRVRVQVLSSASELIDSDESAVTNGSYSSGLGHRVAEGSTVLVMALKDGEPVGTSDYRSVLAVGFNWGRVRAYFSAGTTVATLDKKTESTAQTLVDGVPTKTTTIERKREFASADYFVGFNLDYNILSNLRNRPGRSCARPGRYTEDLEQLESLAHEWNGNNFKQRVSQLRTPPQQVDRARGVLDEIVTALNKIVDGLDASQAASDCSATEQARAAILRASATRLNASQNMFKTFSTTLTRTPAAALPSLSAAIEDVDAVLRTLESDIRDFRKSDPASPSGGRLLNGSFDSRLGQMPVATEAQGSVTAGAAEIVQRPNSVLLAGEVYMPWWSEKMAWMHDGKENALFVAPIFRTGILAADTGPVTETITVKTVDGEDGPEERKGDSNVFRHVFPFWSVGARLGHFALNAKRRDVAPELISYLDITYGRFDNFRLPRVISPTQSTIPPSVDDEIVKRFEIHGRFKIPETPLYVGFTGNVGHGPDDLRFFFGTRFDFSRAIARMLGRQ
jgi:hypothetical protein